MSEHMCSSNSNSPNRDTHQHHEQEHHTVRAELLSPLRALVQAMEGVLMRLDEALLEARLAREAMLLYIQVIL